MTANEYREILNKLTPEQRKELSEAVYLGGNTDVDSMVKIFENNRQKVEPTIVLWLSRNVQNCPVKTEADRVADANITSAAYARRGFNISVWALIIAGLSAVLSLVSLLK
jgi:hypothetical protein